MKKLSIFIIILFTVSFSSYAYAEVKIHPKNNGKVWNTLDEISKKMYVAGYTEGHDAGAEINVIYHHKTRDELEVESESFKWREVLRNADIEQIVSGLDQFYSDFANIKIPISEAVLIIMWKIGGLPEKKLQEKIEEFRQLFSAIE